MGKSRKPKSKDQLFASPAQPKRSLSADGTLTVSVPLTFARRGGRKRVITPDGKPLAALAAMTPDTPLIKALARAYRWKRMLEDGEYSSMQDLAKAERVTPSYLARILRLTLLAPDIVERIFNRPQSDGLLLDCFTQRLPVDWAAQRARCI